MTQTILFWLAVASFGALFGTITFAILDKVTRERRAGHRIKARHFVHPFSDVTNTGHHG